MAIQDISVYLDGYQTGANRASVSGAQVLGGSYLATRLFQDKLESDRLRLAQVTAPVAPPVAPVNITPVQPAPVFLNPSIAPGISAPKPPALTPYTLPSIQPDPKPGLDMILESTGVHAQRLFKQLTKILQSLTAPFSKTDLAAWNSALAKISSTLRLQTLSSAEQLHMNQQADQQLSLYKRYAVGLRTPMDGNLALTGSLSEITRFFQVNAQHFQQFHHHADGLTLKGLEQRYHQALEAHTDNQILNAARNRLKQLEQVLKTHYPTLTLMAKTDRASELQNGVQVNREAGNGLSRLHLLGLNLVAKMPDNTTRNIAASLGGPLQALGQFMLNGGHSWLLMNGLQDTQSTGLTPVGIIQRYAKAHAEQVNLDQTDPQQSGGRLAQPLAEPSDLSEIYDPETSISTELPGGAKVTRLPGFKQASTGEDDSPGIIRVHQSKPAAEVKPSVETSNSVPVNASATNENGQTEPDASAVDNNSKGEIQSEHANAGQSKLSLLNKIKQLEGFEDLEENIGPLSGDLNIRDALPENDFEVLFLARSLTGPYVRAVTLSTGEVVIDVIEQITLANIDKTSKTTAVTAEELISGKKFTGRELFVTQVDASDLTLEKILSIQENAVGIKVTARALLREVDEKIVIEFYDGGAKGANTENIFGPGGLVELIEATKAAN